MSGSLTVRYSFRLRLSKSAERALLEEWDRVRWVWNRCVEASIAAHRGGEECGPARLDRELTRWRAERPWLAAGSSVAQQQVIRADFGPSRTKALLDRKNRVPVSRRRGLPTWKKKDKALPSLNYSRRGFSISPDGRLRLPKGVSVVVVWSREVPSEPASVRVHRDTLGQWFASFVVKLDVAELPATGRAIGIDWGVSETAVTTEEAFDLPHAAHGKRAAERLAHYQRQMARRRPAKGKAASKGYKTVRRQVAKAHRRIARQRDDDRCKWAKAVVRTFDRIAVEDFQPKFLAKSTMARKAADGAIAAAKAELVFQARKHGRALVLVNPAYTTMDCGNCGARAKHRLLLSERTYSCEACGHVAPRDRNSAAVMVARAGFLPAGVDRASPETPPEPLAA